MNRFAHATRLKYMKKPFAGCTYALVPCATAAVVEQHGGAVGTETAAGAHSWTHWRQAVTAGLATAAVTVHHRFWALRVFLTKRRQVWRLSTK